MSENRIDASLSRRGFLRLSAALGAAAVATPGLEAVAHAATLGAPGAKPKIDGDLNLFTWEGYFAPSTIKSFQKEYKVSVNQTYITSSDDQLSKVAAGLPFDVAITNSTQIPKLLKANLLRQIDRSQLKHANEIIKFFRNPPYDSGGKHSIGYAMAPLGLAYRTDRVHGMTGSWSDLWTHAKSIKGHAYMVNAEDLAIAVALMHLGHNENSAVPSQVNAAAKALVQLKPYLGGMVSENTIQIIASGQAWLIPTYTGNVYTALSQAKNAHVIKFELCKEGQMFNADNMSITNKAKHPGTAMLFIDWMLRPDNMKANVEYIGYPVPTTTGLKTYRSLVNKHPWLNVGTALINKASSWEQPLVGQRQQLWNSAWAQVQAG
jgi:spermidine/putrescine-binding protein